MGNWKERLGSYDSWAMSESMFITIDGETIYELDELIDFISAELDKAREEGFEQGYKEAEFDVGMEESFKNKKFTELVSDIAEKLKGNQKKDRLVGVVLGDDTVCVKPEYVMDYSHKLNKSYICGKCGSRCLVPVLHPLAVVCPKCGELSLEEVVFTKDEKEE